VQLHHSPQQLFSTTQKRKRFYPEFSMKQSFVARISKASRWDRRQTWPTGRRKEEEERGSDDQGCPSPAHFQLQLHVSLPIP
jgi:hypothetical protein